MLVLVHPPTTSVHMAQATLTLIGRLTATQGWPDPLLLTEADIEGVTRRGSLGVSYNQILRRFKDRLGLEHVDEIYYAHDVVGRVPELAFNAFPDAERIMYGDALGLVFNRRYLIALAGGSSVEEAQRIARGEPVFGIRQLSRTLRNGFGRALFGGPEWPRPDRAALVLPVDVTGDSLIDVRLTIPSKELVLEVIAECQGAMPEMTDFSRQTLATMPGPHYLLVLENFTDAGMTSLEQERALYEAAIRLHIPKGATVLLKEHPLVTVSVTDALRERIEPDYVTCVLPAELTRYPIELWSELVSRCGIVTMMSYCGLSLKYLYGKDTICALDDDIVERFFYPHTWGELRRMAIHYQGQLDNLANWDGQSILWRGTLQ
jgi:hypothetical protein